MKVTSLNKNNYNNYFYKDKNIIPKNLKITNASRYSCDNTEIIEQYMTCLLYTSPSPRDRTRSRMPSSA